MNIGTENYVTKYYDLCEQMHEEKMNNILEKRKTNQTKFYLQMAIVILSGILINTFIIIA